MAAGLIGLVAGCAGPTPAPRVLEPAPAGGFELHRYPVVGLGVTLPRDWTTVKVYLPLVTLVTSGPAVISLWRYPRSGTQPSTPAQLGQALHRLLAAARVRDPGLRVIASSTVPVAGRPALEVETVQRIGSALRQVNSTHLYGDGQEVVLEEYAPPSMFASLDRSVFSSVRRSLVSLGR